MGQDFSPSPRGGARMGLDFLDPPHPRPSPSLPRPVPPRVAKGYNCKFFSYPNVVFCLYFVMCYTMGFLFYFILFFYDFIIKHLDILFNFFQKIDLI